MQEKIKNLNDYQIRGIFKKIKDFKNLDPEIENINNDPDDRWDLFDILEFNCLEKQLDTEKLVDDYDDVTGALEFLDFRGYIDYYEKKAFGKWKYEVKNWSYLEVPVYIKSNYESSQKYINYRSKLEREFLNNLSNSDLIQKDKYIEIFNQEYDKLLNNDYEMQY